MAGGRIVGALILGNQALADPLRALVEQQVDLSAHQEKILNAGDDLAAAIHEAWRASKTQGN